MLSFQFQKDHPLGKRSSEASRILNKFPDKIAVICEAKDIPLVKNKYLVPGDLTVGQFLHILRKGISMTPDIALFLFTEDNTLPQTAYTMAQMRREHGNPDGFVYLMLRKESTFG